MDFKERLKELRKKRGISQAALAERLGMSKSTIGAYEVGDITPSLEALNALADYFNVDIDYLLGKEPGSTYYLDPEVAELAKALYERPEMRILFDASRDATTDDVKMAAELLNRLSKK